MDFTPLPVDPWGLCCTPMMFAWFVYALLVLNAREFPENPKPENLGKLSCNAPRMWVVGCWPICISYSGTCTVSWRVGLVQHFSFIIIPVCSLIVGDGGSVGSFGRSIPSPYGYMTTTLGDMVQGVPYSLPTWTGINFGYCSYICTYCFWGSCTFFCATVVNIISSFWGDTVCVTTDTITGVSGNGMNIDRVSLFLFINWCIQIGQFFNWVVWSPGKIWVLCFSQMLQTCVCVPIDLVELYIYIEYLMQVFVIGVGGNIFVGEAMYQLCIWLPPCGFCGSILLYKDTKISKLPIFHCLGQNDIDVIVTDYEDVYVSSSWLKL